MTSSQVYLAEENVVGFRKGQALSFENPTDAVAYIHSEKIAMIDACFVDPLGMWHHMTFTPSQCSVKDLEQGWAFDGSSIRLFKSIEESDMIMVPDITTCFLDPFMKHRTLHVTCDVVNADWSEFDRCSRSVLKKTNAHVLKSGICSDIVVGPEVEFFIFDSVTYSNNMQESHYSVETKEGYWETGNSNCARSDMDIGGPDYTKPYRPAGATNANLGHRMLRKQYYAPTIPVDKYNNLRADMMLVMDDLGIPTEKHHHEVATGQQELGVTCSTPIETCDNVMVYKYVVKNTAALANKSATFMPKPLPGDNGSGMHCHFSLWKDNKNLFYDANGSYQNLSPMALHFIAGVLKHAPAVLAFACPTVNSYKRLLPGFEAPSILSYSAGNRSACIRIPIVAGDNWRAKRIEFRCPDPSCNPYLAVSAIILAGMDGVNNKLEPPQPLDKDVYAIDSLSVGSMVTRATPENLNEAMDALEADCEFLAPAFSSSFISTYINYKRAEYRSVTTVVTPKEYEYYYGC